MQKQIDTLKRMIKGLTSDVRNLPTEDFEAVDSMRRTINVMSEIVLEMELELQPEAEEIAA